MNTRPDKRPAAWSSSLKLFHWTCVILMLVLFVLGWMAVVYPLSPAKLALFKWHKSLGLLLLAWVILWLGWRATHRAPGLPGEMSTGEKRGTHLAHGLLFALMITMSISGWVINSSANFPLEWFGLFRVPQITAPDKNVQDAASLIHLVLFWAVTTVLIVHIAAALQHHFVRRDDILLRMLPFTKAGK
ncbi:MAG: cytochrome b [Arenicellales bacterium]